MLMMFGSQEQMMEVASPRKLSGKEISTLMESSRIRDQRVEIEPRVAVMA